MKTRILLPALLAVMLFSAFTYANGNKNVPKANTYEAIEMNRLIGLATDNEGLRTSCAIYLGEMKSQKAVVPLMKLLRESPSCQERIVAALSLVRIGDPQGIYLVGRLGQFHECEKTRQMCERFYVSYQYHKLIDQQTIDEVKNLAMLNN